MSRIEPSPTMHARPLHPAVHLEAFGEAGRITADDVLALWDREHAVVGEEARRRVDEVVVVAAADTGELVGVSTAEERFVSRLGVHMWAARVFVAEDVRNGNVAAHLLDAGHRILAARASGAGVPGIAGPAGVLLEVQHAGVAKVMNEAVWSSTRFAYVGDNQRGDPVRVRYFDGAVVPPRPVPRG